MSSTFTSSKLLEKQGTGDNSGTWGVVLNSVLDDLDSAIGGVGTKSVAGSSNVTLTDDEALPAVLKLTGLLTGSINVVVPSRTALYTIWNATTGSFNLTVKTSGGNGIMVPQGTRRRLLCDATDVMDETIQVVPGALAGLTLSNNGSDAQHDIDIAAGSAADSTNTYLMALAATMTKRLDASWAVGTGNGGIFTGSIASSTWYHVFLIRKDSDGSVDAGFDTSVSAANKPAGYSSYRRIGSVRTDGSSNLLQFWQRDDHFFWQTTSLDIGGSATAGAWTNLTVRAPSGVQTMVFGAGQNGSGGAGGASEVALRNPSGSDSNPTAGAGTGIARVIVGSSDIIFFPWGPVLTDTSSRIQYYTSGNQLFINTRGYIDARGRG